MQYPLMIQSPSSVFLRLLLLSWLYPCCSLSNPSPSLGSNRATTIAVCTGPDCRVDGSSNCLKALQRSLRDTPEIRVTGRPCLGPCGDGPCVLVLDNQQKKVVVQQPSKTAISLASPDLFGSSPQGWYQVRTAEQVDEVLEIACQAASLKPLPAIATTTTTITSTRPWYDRPRNERKVLQRLLQFTVLVGVAQYDKSHIEGAGDLQYGIAGGLFLFSTLIMKENIWNTLLPSLARKMKRRRST